MELPALRYRQVIMRWRTGPELGIFVVWRASEVLWRMECAALTDVQPSFLRQSVEHFVRVERATTWMFEDAREGPREQLTFRNSVVTAQNPRILINGGD